MEPYSAIEQNEIMPFPAAWMDLEKTMLSDESRTEKDNITHMWDLKCDTDELLCDTDRLIHAEKSHAIAKRQGAKEGKNWEPRVSRYKLSHIKWINGKILVYFQQGTILNIL